MKRAILMLWLLVSIPCFAKDPFVGKVRALYQKAGTEEKSCRELIGILSPYTVKNNPLFWGYKAGATMIMAKHVFNPVTKLSYFNRGKKMLKKAIEADKDNIELRYLRFSLQSNAPSFLGYNDHIALDKALLIESIPLLEDTALKRLIVSVLKSSDYLK